MSDHEFITPLREWMKRIAREVFEEVAPGYLGQMNVSDDAPAKLCGQLALIKVKERVTVKEAALLLSCSESHIRKLVMLARKGKSRRPIPFVDMEGVTVFPLSDLLDWASPQPQLQPVHNKHAIRNRAA